MIASLASLSVVATSLSLASAAPASAAPAGDALVISEVYGGGGNAGATLTNDFIELYNPTDARIPLDGMSVQYRSSGNNPGGVTDLTGSVPAGGHWLVQEAAGTGGTDALPTPDATGSLAMSGSNGIVVLAEGTDPVDPATAGAELVDLVGYGSVPQYEGSGAAPALSNTTSASRDADGADTDDNAADLTTGDPTPQNSGGDGGPADPPPSSGELSIAEIQGDGDASPVVGETVTTQGVVTATYRTGGIDGLYVQTGGTGRGTDATPGASDGLFVNGAALEEADYRVGASLEITGAVAERFGVTEIKPASPDGVTSAGYLPVVTPLATELPATETEREAHEGELLAPQGGFTVTNSYDTNRFAEIGLAAGDTPLIQPTEVEDAQTGDVAEIEADNAARAVTLDDGANVDFTAAGSDTPVPYLTRPNGSPRPVRVGAPVTFTEPVVLTYGFNTWRFQPTARITAEDGLPVTIENTRTDAPQAVAGDVRLATFNVLNYFATTGEEFVASGGTCTYYEDRQGNPVTTNRCDPDGPRGAADDANLERQQAKIVAAINTLSADVVSLEEIENSVKFDQDRDAALSTLVDALNAAAGGDTWDFVPSPAASELPALGAQDVIRTAFIYKPSALETVGTSRVLVDDAFANARQPLAQAFKPAGAEDADAFTVIVNHFKSKGSGADDGTGQGNANPDRVAQAEALATFADDVESDSGIAKTFLTGDFNAYSQEDPMQVLYDAGYTQVESDTEGEETYSFSGLSGSLDHVLANDAAYDDVAGADVWNINSGESLAFEYSRYNNNVTDFYAPDVFRASDHDPEIVGINPGAGGGGDGVAELNLLSVNDFHGRIFDQTVKWAGTVEQLRAEGGEDKTLFVGAGDLIGASLFASNVAQDQPTIDVMNALGLDASAVGNHEFDKGFVDLRDRVIGPDGDRNAMWDYLGANVYEKGTQDPVLPEFALFTVDGVDVAVIGTVTEETASLVSPAGISDIEFGNATEATNRVAAQLHDGDEANGEADVIVASFHAGANQGTATYEENLADGGEFADMADLDPAVDVIFNGHTHQVYAYDAPVVGGDLPTRPMLQTGSYADNVGQVTLEVDRATGDVLSYEARNVARTDTPDDELVSTYPRVAEVKRIVDEALANAAEIGNQPIAEITGDITTAFTGGTYGADGYEGGERDDRSAESTLGDLVATMLRDGPDVAEDPDLGITNPGGLRAELLYDGDTSSNPQNTDGVVTYAEANAVLPFGNTVALVDLTGAQLEEVLEQQWQPDGSSRPYLQLGLSDNVRVTVDPSRERGDRVTSVLIDDEPLDPTATYTVSTLNFLATGGDNFTAFTQGDVTDTGYLDAEVWRDYLAASTPLSPDFARQQVQVDVAPRDVESGEQVAFTVSNLDLTSLGSPQNTELTVYVGSDPATEVGTFDVVDGSARVELTVPDGVSGMISAVAAPSGTVIGPGVPAPTTLAATAQRIRYGRVARVEMTVDSDTPVQGGTVTVLDGDTEVGSASVTDGGAAVLLPRRLLEPGRYTLGLTYSGDDTHSEATGEVVLRVLRARPRIRAVAPDTVRRGSRPPLRIKVAAPGVTPRGYVVLRYNGDQQVVALHNGTARTRLDPLDRAGTINVRVRYRGTDLVGPVRTIEPIRVLRRR